MKSIKEVTIAGGMLKDKLQKMMDINAELEQMASLRLSAKAESWPVDDAFSDKSALYAEYCVSKGYEYKLGGIHEVIGGKILLHVAIIEGRENRNLLPVHAPLSNCKTIC